MRPRCRYRSLTGGGEPRPGFPSQSGTRYIGWSAQIGRRSLAYPRRVNARIGRTSRRTSHATGAVPPTCANRIANRSPNDAESRLPLRSGAGVLTPTHGFLRQRDPLTAHDCACVTSCRHQEEHKRHEEHNHQPLRRCARVRPHDRIQTYWNGVSHVRVPDPQGNAIAVGEAPDAATASPR